MENQQSILIIDDSIQIQALLESALEDVGYRCVLASTGAKGIQDALSEPPGIIFLDVQLPDMGGLEVMRSIKEQNSRVPIIVMTGNTSMNLALQAMQQGAFDYITKPFLLHTIRDAAKRAFASVQQDSAFRVNHSFSAGVIEEKRMIGSSAVLKEVFKMLGLVCSTPNKTSVLIQGESGTGKELIAQTIHTNSATASEPFVGINCTAIPENLLESELFGSERGAYTGATQRRIGKFEAAGAGTIFLDEIGDLPLSLQAKLLRVLQERTFERIGGNDTIPVRARFITATHRDLAEEVRKGTFREDLFYRLNIAVVHLPPLRERRDDIQLLANYFLSKYNTQMNKAVMGFSEEALAALKHYAFPGNVRELENIVERAVMLCTSSVIQVESFGISAVSDMEPVQPPASSTLAHGSEVLKSEESHPTDTNTLVETDNDGTIFSIAREAAIANFERCFITKLLTLHHGNVSVAAKEAHLSRTHFHELMRRYGVTAQKFRKKH